MSTTVDTTHSGDTSDLFLIGQHFGDSYGYSEKSLLLGKANIEPLNYTEQCVVAESTEI